MGNKYGVPPVWRKEKRGWLLHQKFVTVEPIRVFNADNESRLDIGLCFYAAVSTVDANGCICPPAIIPAKDKAEGLIEIKLADKAIQHVTDEDGKMYIEKDHVIEIRKLADPNIAYACVFDTEGRFKEGYMQGMAKEKGKKNATDETD